MMYVPGSISDPACAPTRSEVSNMVDRVRALVSKYGKGSPKLRNVATFYGWLQATGDAGSFGLLRAAVEELEREDHPSAARRGHEGEARGGAS